jgi:hypothetical protein
MKTYHLSWITKDAEGYHGHWMHLKAKTKRDAQDCAELILANNNLVKNGAGTYFNIEGTSNCLHD